MEKKFVVQYLALVSAMVISKKAFVAVAKEVMIRQNALVRKEMFVAPVQWTVENDENGQPVFRTKGNSFGAGGSAEEASLKHGVIADTELTVSKAEATLAYWKGRLESTLELLAQAESIASEWCDRDLHQDEEILFCEDLKAKAQQEVIRLRGEWTKARSSYGKKLIEDKANQEKAVIKNSDIRIAKRMAKLEKNVGKKVSWACSIQDSVDYIMERIEAAESALMTEDDIAAGIVAADESFSLVTEDGSKLPNWEHFKYARLESEEMLAMVEGRISRGLNQEETIKLIEKLMGERKYTGGITVEVYPVTKDGETTMMAKYCDNLGGYSTLVFNPSEKIAAGLVDGELVEIDVPNGKSVIDPLKMGKYTKKAFAEAMIALIDNLDLSLLKEKEAKKFERRYNKYCADLEAKLEEAENRAEEKAANDSLDAQDNSFGAEELSQLSTMSVEASIDWKRMVDRTISSLMRGMKMSREEATCAAILQHEAMLEQDAEPFRNFRKFDETVEGFSAHFSSKA